MSHTATPEAQNTGIACAIPQPRATRVRLVILALLAVGTMINYLDRTVLGIAAIPMARDLGISNSTLGFVHSAFFWTYVITQVPGGLFLDRFGSKLTYFLALTFWSMFTALQGAAVGLKSLLLFRFGLGVSEAPCFPTNSRVVGTWFPQQERARATAVYTVGEYLGLACFSPLLFWILGAHGWRTLFFTVGSVGIIFALVWWRVYQSPRDSKKINQEELDYIAAGGGLEVKKDNREPFTFAKGVRLLKYRQVLGASIGQFAGNTVLVFFLTWFPTYLATERHMTFIKVGFYAVMPYLAAAFGVMFGGWLSDQLLQKTGSANISRKFPIISGLIMASTIFAANFVDSNFAVIAILSFAFFGQGMVGLGWTVISDVAPKKYMGITGGLFNLCTNLSGILTPLIIGFIIQYTGHFFYALTYVGAAALLGVFSYVFILGDIKRLDFD